MQRAVCQLRPWLVADGRDAWHRGWRQECAVRAGACERLDPAWAFLSPTSARAKPWECAAASYHRLRVAQLSHLAPDSAGKATGCKRGPCDSSSIPSSTLFPCISSPSLSARLPTCSAPRSACFLVDSTGAVADEAARTHTARHPFYLYVPPSAFICFKATIVCLRSMIDL